MYTCTGGCKVDLTCSQKYCIDYAVREGKKNLIPISKLKELAKIFEKEKPIAKSPKEYRKFKPNPYAKLNLWHKEKYLITRYQTISLDHLAIQIIKSVLGKIRDEESLIEKFKDRVEEKEIRNFVTKLINVGAIDI